MRNLVVFLFISFGLWSCNHEKSTSFTVNGQIEDVKDSTEIFLSYFTFNNGIWNYITDTAYVKNKKFHFKGNIDDLTAGYLGFNDIGVPIYLEPVPIQLVIDKNDPYSYKLSGTNTEKESIELRNKLSANMMNIDKIQYSVNEIFKQINLHNGDSTLVDSLMKKVYQFRAESIINGKQIDSIQMNFIKKHNTYQIAPHLVYLLAWNEILNIDTVAAIYNNLPEQSKTTLLGKLALEQIKQVKRDLNKKDILAGDTAPDFTRVSMQGDTIRLTDYRGKSCVLLDFWASWCGPCIKGIPDIKSIYNEHNKNLTIIGISLDQNKEKWLNAINKHQIGIWYQILSNYVLDNNYFVNEMNISEIYNVKIIPTYVFIDKEGKVIAIWHSIGKGELSDIDRVLKNK